MPWQPLSVRLGDAPPIDQTWQEGVPAWINQSLREWLAGGLHDERVRDVRSVVLIGSDSPESGWRQEILTRVLR
jgi:hypothetical protein